MVLKLLATLVLTICAAHVVHGRQLIGSQPCTFGPSYWCQSFKTAAECGANYHCMEHVWSKNPYGYCSGLLCHTCKDIVKHYLSMNKLKAEIKDTLEQFCKKEGQYLSTPCDYIVTHDLMPFLGQLLNTMTPEKICSMLNVCKSKMLTQDNLKDILAPGIVKNILTPEKIKQILSPGAARKEKIINGLNNIMAPGAVRNIQLNTVVENQQVPKADSLSCITCSIIVGKIDAALGNENTENKIVNGTDRICRFLPERLSNECQAYVNQFGPPILQALLQYLPAKQVCAYYIHACPQSTLGNNGVQIAAPTRLASSICVICELAVRTAEGMLQINKTENEIFHAIDVLCNTTVPAGILRKQCNEVFQPIKDLFNKFNKFISPSSICSYVGLCKKSEMAPKKLDVCRLGPRFWCATKETAALCKKTKHCNF